MTWKKHDDADQVSCLVRGSDGRNLTVTQLAEKDQVIITIITLPHIILFVDINLLVNIVAIIIIIILIITEIPPRWHSHLCS